VIPSDLIAQNAALIRRDNPITVIGCAKTKMLRETERREEHAPKDHDSDCASDRSRQWRSEFWHSV
jgi:hypothetical protein